MNVHATNKQHIMQRPDQRGSVKRKQTVPCCLQIGGFLYILSLTRVSEDVNRRRGKKMEEANMGEIEERKKERKKERTWRKISMSQQLLRDEIF